MLPRKLIPKRKKKPLPLKLPRQVPPKLIELDYAGHLVKRIINPLRKHYAPVIALAKKKHAEASQRTDADDDEEDGDDFDDLMDDAADGMAASMEQADLEDLAAKYGAQTGKYQRQQLLKSVAPVLGTDPLIGDKGLNKRLRTFVDHNVTLVSRIPKECHDDLADLIEQGTREAWSTRDIVDQMQYRFNVSESHARLIARDQVGQLYADVNHTRQRDLGITRFVWRTANDERVRGDPDGLYPKALPSHFDLDGQTFSYDDPPTDEDGPFLPGDQIQCFPGDTKVSSYSRVEKLYRRRYTGKTTILTTNDGRVLTSTPNHPILTRRGWIDAHKVQVGDDLVQITREGIQVLPSVLDGENRDATFEQVFSALVPLGHMHCAVGREGFHGEMSVDEQVDIVDVDRCLTFELNPVFTEAICKEILCNTDDLILGHGQLDFMFGRVSASANGIVRSGSKLLASLLGGFGHTDEHCLGAISRLQSIANKLSANASPGDAEMICHTFNTPPVGVELRHHLARVVYSVTRKAVMQSLCLDTPSAEIVAEIVSTDSENLGSLGDGVDFQKFSRVIEKLDGEFTNGHVYNMQTKASWYIAQGLAVHNCRCFSEPVLEDLLGDDDDEDTDSDEDEESDDDTSEEDDNDS